MTRKLDALVETRVMGATPAVVAALALGTRAYSSDIAAAWAVLNSSKSIQWEMGNDPCGWGEVKLFPWRGTIEDGDHVEIRMTFEHPDKAPLAICLAALRAAGVSEEEIQEALKE